MKEKNTIGAEALANNRTQVGSRLREVRVRFWRGSNQVFFSLFIIFLLIIFPHPSLSFTNNFNVTSDDQLITLTGHPGNSYDLYISLESNDPSLTVYPVGLSLPSESSYSATGSWITFSQSSLNLVNSNTTPLNFTVSIPSNTAVGEYYKSVAVADIPFVDGESSNPPTLLAVPLTIQVSEVATESASTTTTTDSSSTSNQSSATAPTLQTLTPYKFPGGSSKNNQNQKLHSFQISTPNYLLPKFLPAIL